MRNLLGSGNLLGFTKFHIILCNLDWIFGEIILASFSINFVKLFQFGNLSKYRESKFRKKPRLQHPLLATI